MKPQFKILITACLCVSFFAITAFSGCDGNEDIYPKKISFTEYSLDSTPCQWTESSDANMVMVINSDEELRNHIECLGGGSYPEIDFLKHTLLLAKGGSGDVRELDVVFSQNAENRYTLKVTIHLGMATVSLPWFTELLVPKISDEAIVTLEIEETFN